MKEDQEWKENHELGADDEKIENSYFREAELIWSLRAVQCAEIEYLLTWVFRRFITSRVNKIITLTYYWGLKIITIC